MAEIYDLCSKLLPRFSKNHLTSIREYHIVQIFVEENLGKWQITGGSLHFTIQILTMPQDINKESKQAGFRQSFTRQMFLIGNLP